MGYLALFRRKRPLWGNYIRSFHAYVVSPISNAFSFVSEFIHSHGMGTYLTCLPITTGLIVAFLRPKSPPIPWVEYYPLELQ